MTVHDLPKVDATLNGISTLLIILGWVMIRTHRKRVHALCMVSAIAASALFLGCYLYYHFHVGHVAFTQTGWPRTLYFLILFTHLPLALTIVPLLAFTVTPAHKRVARWTLPIWLYVSVTGVLVYLMLYIWFPSAKI